MVTLSAEDFAESVIEIAVIDIVVVVVGHHSARTDIGMTGNDGGIRANSNFLDDTVKGRGGTASRRRRGRNRVKRTVDDA